MLERGEQARALLRELEVMPQTEYVFPMSAAKAYASIGDANRTFDSLERGLLNHPLIDSDEQRRRYADLVAQVREELEDTVKDEVRSAVAADVEAVQRLCCNYVDAVSTSVNGENPESSC